MKNLLLFALLTACACSQKANSKCNLDGRSFRIETFVDGKPDGTEILMFKDGKAQNDECTKYGFGSGDYTCDPSYNFQYTLTSPAEGRMDWNGKVSANNIEGQMVWVKAGQNDIHYTFKGEENR